MTRIALFLPSLAGGGAQRVFLLLARGIRTHGYDVDVVVPNLSGPLATEIPPGVRLVPLDAPRVASGLLPLVRYIRREQPAALVSAMSHGNVVAVAAVKLARMPTRAIVTEHQHLTTFVAHAPARRDRHLPLLVRATYRYADHVVAVSHGVATDLGRHARIPRDRIHVIYNPVPVDELRRQAEEAPEHEWTRPGEIPFVLGVGRLSEQKDFATLVRAFGILSRRTPCRLVILGEGPLRLSLQRLIRQQGVEDRAWLPGFVPNPYPWIRRAGVVALSSRWEGLPTVLLEAMALDAPIVSTDCRSGPAELLAGGTLGTLVPPGDVVALATALEDALRHPERGRNSSAVAHLTVERVAARYVSLVNDDGRSDQNGPADDHNLDRICVGSSA
jgi:glycosyltransferase involved in cell wall biosynthesis